MKKFLMALLALALVCSMAVPAFAADPVTGTGVGENTTDVTAKYTAVETEAKYSVNITWGTFEFTYNEATEGTWDPTKLEYENGTEAAWAANENATVKVENRSNVGIEVALTFTADSAYEGITGSFGEYEGTMAAATEKAKKGTELTATLALSNLPTSADTFKQNTTFTKIGTVKVAITAAA